MNTTHPPVEYKGRIIGIVFLVAAQLLVGFVHLIFGFWLLSSPPESSAIGVIGSLAAPEIYSIYTIIFSVLTLMFAALLWAQKRWGWVGTFGVLIFVIIADSLTLLDLPSVPGIPKFAGYGEITYSIFVIIYLLQNHVRIKYRINF
jgi:hypothetical protein